MKRVLGILTLIALLAMLSSCGSGPEIAKAPELQTEETSSSSGTTESSSQEPQTQAPTSETTEPSDTSDTVEEDSSDIPWCAPGSVVDGIWMLDADALNDEDVIFNVLCPPEIGLVDEGFTFDSPDELSSDRLFMLFLLWTDYEDLAACQNPEDQQFYFEEEQIRSTLDRYFKEYVLDMTEIPSYDSEHDAVVVGNASGFGGDRDMRIVDREVEGNTVTFTVDFHQRLYFDERPDTEVYQQKVYTIEFYDGGYYFLCAKKVA